MFMKTIATALTVALLGGSVACDSGPKRVERWATTENTTVALDWDKVNQAYKDASGPEDFEKRVNEIYQGDEVISVAVQDQGDKTQIVTGFFDRNLDGKVEDAEKIFTIKRDPTGEGTGQYQTVGYNSYAGYMSPMLGIASGMLLGSMISNMFMPTYVPMYTRPYVTSATRVSSLHSERSSYRSSSDYRRSSPSTIGPRSKSGRNYGGSAPSRPSGSRSSGSRSGGGFFGLRRGGRTRRPERLVA
jgi:hypothetical protein